VLWETNKTQLDRLAQQLDQRSPTSTTSAETIAEYQRAVHSAQLDATTRNDHAALTSLRQHGRRLRRFTRIAARVENETAMAVIDRGLSVQQQSSEHLRATLNTIENSKEIGIATVTTLRQGNDHIVHVYDQLEQIESTLTRSIRAVSRVARRMLCDKYLCVAVWLLAVVSVAVVIVEVRR
jgi:hypothetical protein